MSACISTSGVVHLLWYRVATVAEAQVWNAMADIAGKMAVNKEHVAAAALLRAFFACCANDELCKGFLVRQHATGVVYANSTNSS